MGLDLQALDAHIPDLVSQERDEVGLVRAITVKARSSSQRKALFNAIQEQNKVKGLQLLLDMKVRGVQHLRCYPEQNYDRS